MPIQILAHMGHFIRTDGAAIVWQAGQILLSAWTATVILGVLAIMFGGVVEGVKVRIQRRRRVVAPPMRASNVTAFDRRRRDAIDDSWDRLQLEGLSLSDLERRRN